MKIIIKTLIAFTILTSIMNSCNLAGTCGNDLIKEVSNNNYKVFIFFRDCGATTANSVQVSILNSNKKFDDDIMGNVFTVDDINTKSYLDSSSIDVKWLSKDSLEIIFDKKLNTYNKEVKVSDISIVYVER